MWLMCQFSVSLLPAKCVMQKSSQNLDVDDLDTAAILNTLASLYMDMDRPLDALPLYQRALSSVQVTSQPWLLHWVVIQM
jgi:hypothetical protein